LGDPVKTIRQPYDFDIFTASLLTLLRDLEDTALVWGIVVIAI
jgi:hypothetical protein